MKNQTVASLLLVHALASSHLFADGGSLTPPPGAPAPTMKSLDQVEARTPLVEGEPGVTIDPGTNTITISVPGSYYLTGNHTVSGSAGISINAEGVTLDLNGYTVSSTADPASGQGVMIVGSDTTIFNGHIRGGVTYDGQAEGNQFTGSGFATGLSSASLDNILVHDLSVKGCSVDGIDLARSQARSCVVRSCTVNVAGGVGIEANVVSDCSVATTGGESIHAITVSNCQAYSVGASGIAGYNIDNSSGETIDTGAQSHGIRAFFSVANSTGSSEGGSGILAGLAPGEGGVATGCAGISHGEHSSSHGISADYAINGCSGRSSSGDGLRAPLVSNSYGYSDGDDGIEASQVNYSYGRRSAGMLGKNAIEANHAIGCTALGSTDITNKYLMP